jgi:anhydro-N-acetylmuramic acid kinase
MSGTSVDAVDAALVCIAGHGASATVELVAYLEMPIAAGLRQEVFKLFEQAERSIARLCSLNVVLGERFAEAALAICRQAGVPPESIEVIGSHGQTVWHQPEADAALPLSAASTLQIGEPAVIAARTGVRVVADFRAADMAAGGQGAPLVPYLDYRLYRHHRVGRIALNIGGIANVTAIPAGATAADVIAFDTGPGNMVIDALSERHYAQRYDRNGTIAAAGRLLEPPISRFLRARFFRQEPPKTAGRENFGREFAEQFRRACLAGSRGQAQAGRVQKADIIASATAFTARSIGDALRRYVLPRGSFAELIVSGGGASNPTLMAGLGIAAGGLGLRLRSSDEFGIPSEAKEAVAFAVLAFETWNRRPSNLPSATGAKRPAVLGKVSYP